MFIMPVCYACSLCLFVMHIVGDNDEVKGGSEARHPLPQ